MIFPTPSVSHTQALAEFSRLLYSTPSNMSLFAQHLVGLAAQANATPIGSGPGPAPTSSEAAPMAATGNGESHGSQLGDETESDDDDDDDSEVHRWPIFFPIL